MKKLPPSPHAITTREVLSSRSFIPRQQFGRDLAFARERRISRHDKLSLFGGKIVKKSTLYYLSCFPRTCYKRYPRTFTILKLPIPRYPSLPARCFYSLDRAFLNDLRIRRISRRILRSFPRFALSRKFYDYDKMKKRIGTCESR